MLEINAAMRKSIVTFKSLRLITAVCIALSGKSQGWSEVDRRAMI